jgi:hypothetical protein
VGESIVATLKAAAKRHGVALAYRGGEIHVGGRRTDVDAFKDQYGDVIAGLEAMVAETPQQGAEAEAAHEAVLVAEWTKAANGAERFMDLVQGGGALPRASPPPVARIEPPPQPPAWQSLPPPPMYNGHEVAMGAFFEWLARWQVAKRRGERFSELPPHRIPQGWWLGGQAWDG